MRQNDTKHTMQQGTEMRDAFPLFCWNAPDTEFFWLVLLLTTIGLIMLLSASYPTAYYEQGYPYFYFARQLIFAVIGILLMIGISFINYEYFRILGKPLIIISLLLLKVGYRLPPSEEEFFKLYSWPMQYDFTTNPLQVFTRTMAKQVYPMFKHELESIGYCFVEE